MATRFGIWIIGCVVSLMMTCLPSVLLVLLGLVREGWTMQNIFYDPTLDHEGRQPQ